MFLKAGGEVELYYGLDGQWSRTITDMNMAELPDSARQLILKEAGNEFRVEDVERVSEDRPEKYLVTLENVLYEWLYTFDADGDLIEKIREQ
jgi:hypothetical protein